MPGKYYLPGLNISWKFGKHVEFHSRIRSFSKELIF